MFEKIKRNLFKFFNRKVVMTEAAAENEVIDIDECIVKDDVVLEVTIVDEEVIAYDPKEKLRKKLHWIAINTNKFRIRKKNIRRISELY